jgi:hypothetical protein
MVGFGAMQRLTCAIALVWLAACGGGDDDTGASSSSCGAVTGCGGELKGTWKVSALCADVSAMTFLSSDAGLPAECNQTVIDALHTAKLEPVNAQVEFGTDQYAQSGNVRLNATYQFTQPCLQAIANGAPVSSSSCAMMGDLMGSDMGTFTCSGSGASCRCQESQLIALNDSGSYRTDKSRIFFDNDTESGAYCVQGKTASVYVSALGGSYERFDLTKTSASSAVDAGM